MDSSFTREVKNIVFNEALRTKKTAPGDINKIIVEVKELYNKVATYMEKALECTSISYLLDKKYMEHDKSGITISHQELGSEARPYRLLLCSKDDLEKSPLNSFKALVESLLKIDPKKLDKSLLLGLTLIEYKNKKGNWKVAFSATHDETRFGATYTFK